MTPRGGQLIYEWGRERNSHSLFVFIHLFDKLILDISLELWKQILSFLERRIHSCRTLNKARTCYSNLFHAAGQEFSDEKDTFSCPTTFSKHTSVATLLSTTTLPRYHTELKKKNPSHLAFKLTGKVCFAYKSSGFSRLVNTFEFKVRLLNLSMRMTQRKAQSSPWRKVLKRNGLKRIWCRRAWNC